MTDGRGVEYKELLLRRDIRLSNHKNISNISFNYFDTLYKYIYSSTDWLYWSLMQNRIEKSKRTLRSLNVSVAIKWTEMGKKVEESACGTTNSIDPLRNIFKSDQKKIQKYKDNIIAY